MRRKSTGSGTGLIRAGMVHTGVLHTRVLHSGFFRVCTAVLVIMAMLALPIRADAWSGNFLESVKSFVQSMYIEGKTDDELLENALKGMFSNLDDYSSFLDQEETKAYEATLTGQFSGIGVVLEPKPSVDGIVIDSVLPDSPAEKAGLLDGDILLKVDGNSLAGKTVTEAVVLIRGAAGTTASILVKRGTKEFTVAVVRGDISINPVSSRIDGKIGYLRITQFGNGASSGVETALAAFRKAGVKKLMLDLRDNPGGYVGQAVEIARMMLPPGPIVSIDYRTDQFSDITYGSDAPDPGWIIAVLANENTASTAEILTGAIQDAGNGFLVGKKTYGKGVVQSLFMLLTPAAHEKYKGIYQETFVTDIEWASYYGVQIQPDEVLGLAKLTTGRYLTRNGRAINGEGLVPEAEAENRTLAHAVDISLIGPLSGTAILKMDSYDASVRKAESILKAGGFFTGMPDRRFDRETLAAVKAYQKANKIAANGLLDTNTTAFLNRTLMTLRLANDPQYKLALTALGLFADK
jgi:carboxyl-terminal processing protease